MRGFHNHTVGSIFSTSLSFNAWASSGRRSSLSQRDTADLVQSSFAASAGCERPAASRAFRSLSPGDRVAALDMPGMVDI